MKSDSKKHEMKEAAGLKSGKMSVKSYVKSEMKEGAPKAKAMTDAKKLKSGQMSAKQYAKKG